MRPHNGAMPARRRGRPRRREDAAALAHRRQAAGRTLVHGRQLPRRHSADGLVDGARKGSPVRRADDDGDSDDQGASSTSVIRHLRPPPYPYAIDRALAERGRALFYSAEIGCSRVPWHLRRQRQRRLARRARRRRHRSRAPRDRVASGSSTRSTAVRSRRDGALVKSHGYAATPLTGVWANYPYLHNGSVPTLHHLLGPVVRAAGDLRSDGGAHVRSRARRSAAVRRSRRTIARTRPSCAAGSATIATGSSIDGQARRTWDTTCGRESGRTRIERALIEYLKTL